MKTKEKTVVEKGSENKQELRECFVLWKKVSKNNVEYLSGYVKNGCDIVGFFNTNKKNPKEPDIRIYCENEKEKTMLEICSLWDNVSKNNNRYLAGVTNEDEKIIAFYDGENKRPYIKAYYK